MKKISKLLLVLLVSVSLINCASFSNKDFKNDYIKINESEINSFNGKYNLLPIKQYRKKNKNATSDSLGSYQNLYDYITTENLKFENKDSILKNSVKYQIELNIVNNTAISIELFKDNYSIRKQQIKGILKKDGMFYLDNNFLECNGIPYLFGGCRNNKRRIGISKNNNLIVNEAVSNEGAILLIIGDGYSYNSAYEFKRLN